MEFLRKMKEENYEKEALDLIKDSPTKLRPLWLLMSEIVYMIGIEDKVKKREPRLSLNEIRELHSYIYYSFDKMRYFKENLKDG